MTMGTTTPHVDELIEEYALGLLDSDEMMRVEPHLEICAACRRRMDVASRTAAFLAQAAQPAPPAPEVGQRLMTRVRAAQRRAPRRVLPERPRPLSRPRGAPTGLNLWPLIAITNLALTVVVAVWGLALQAQLRQLEAENARVVERLARGEKRIALVSSPAAKMIEMAGTENSPDAGGRAYLDRATNTAWITVYDLPEVGEGETYQAWLIGPGGPMNGGTFKTTADGRGEIWITNAADLSEYNAVGVSREPAGGSKQPTRVVIVGGL